MRQLLVAKADPKLAHADGSTLLHIATQQGHVAVVEFLLRANDGHGDDSKVTSEALAGIPALAEKVAQKEGAKEVPAPQNEERNQHPIFDAAAVVAGTGGGGGDAAAAAAAAAADAAAAAAAAAAATAVAAAAVVAAPSPAPSPVVDVNARNGSGSSSALLATGLGHTAVLEQLLAGKADANLARVDGVTPLVIAAKLGRPDLTRLLLAYNADPQLATVYGSPLAFAHASGSAECVQLLLEAKATLPFLATEDEVQRQ